MEAGSHARSRPGQGNTRRVRGPVPRRGRAMRPARFAPNSSDTAQKAFIRAKEKKAVGDLTTARDELTRAAALDPTIEGVREMQRELRIGYPILYVGVRQFPVNLSPATARLDSEKQAVELIFEGLLEEVPEENGQSATGRARRWRCRSRCRAAASSCCGPSTATTSAAPASTATTSSAP